MAKDLPWYEDTPKSVAKTPGYPPALIPIRLRHARSADHERIIAEIAEECGVTVASVRKEARAWLEKKRRREEALEQGDYMSLGYQSDWRLSQILSAGLELAPRPYLESRALWPLINAEKSCVKTLREFAYRRTLDKGEGRFVASRYLGSALVALASDGSRVTAAQALILDPSLTWAETEPRNKDVKIRVTEGEIRGSTAVRLAPVRSGVLAIAEGVETAMSYTRLTGTPCWARLGDVGSFVPPEGVRRLVMVHDGDEKAERSWMKLNARLKRRLDDLVCHQADDGDMNDMWRRRNGEG